MARFCNSRGQVFLSPVRALDHFSGCEPKRGSSSACVPRKHLRANISNSSDDFNHANRLATAEMIPPDGKEDYSNCDADTGCAKDATSS